MNKKLALIVKRDIKRCMTTAKNNATPHKSKMKINLNGSSCLRDHVVDAFCVAPVTEW